MPPTVVEENIASSPFVSVCVCSVSAQQHSTHSTLFQLHHLLGVVVVRLLHSLHHAFLLTAGSFLGCVENRETRPKHTQRSTVEA